MTSRRTLLVEDDPDTSEALTRILRRRGYEVECANSVRQALEKLDTQPESIVLDLMLPDGNGIELLRHVRQAGLPVRVAIATGAGDTDLMSDAILLKPDAFFTKPIDATELVSWLASAHDAQQQQP
jgi:two-component system OmpR family response regulator/two-component system response regulator QseB